MSVICQAQNSHYDFQYVFGIEQTYEQMYYIGLCGNPKVGSESVFESPNRTEAKISKPNFGFPRFIRKPKLKSLMSIFYLFPSHFFMFVQ